MATVTPSIMSGGSTFDISKWYNLGICDTGTITEVNTYNSGWDIFFHIKPDHLSLQHSEVYAYMNWGRAYAQSQIKTTLYYNVKANPTAYVGKKVRFYVHPSDIIVYPDTLKTVTIAEACPVIAVLFNYNGNLTTNLGAGIVHYGAWLNQKLDRTSYGCMTYQFIVCGWGNYDTGAPIYNTFYQGLATFYMNGFAPSHLTNAASNNFYIFSAPEYSNVPIFPAVCADTGLSQNSMTASSTVSSLSVYADNVGRGTFTYSSTSGFMSGEQTISFKTSDGTIGGSGMVGSNSSLILNAIANGDSMQYGFSSAAVIVELI